MLVLNVLLSFNLLSIRGDKEGAFFAERDTSLDDSSQGTFIRLTYTLVLSVLSSDLNKQSLHESIILKKVTVTPISEHAPRSFTSPATVSDPPFCVMGLSDQPFLARITLEWAGTQNNPTHVEHWVDVSLTRVPPI